mgnify:CR=1 FL=1
MEVKLDLHIHSEHSPDGRMALDEIVACARARGLQGVAVCDHDRALTETWDAPDFLLIPGIELSTDRGHLLGLFVTEQIEAWELDAAIDAGYETGSVNFHMKTFDAGFLEELAQKLNAVIDGRDFEITTLGFYLNPVEKEEHFAFLKTVIDSAREGDFFALDIFKKYVHTLAMGIINLINLLDPDIIAIGGGVAAAGDFLLEPLRAEVAEHIYFKDLP